jgi:hypothetical protein
MRGHDNTEFRCLANLAQQVGAGEQRLGWDAPPVEARSTQLSALDQRDLSTELCCAQRGNITGGTTAEDDDPFGHGAIEAESGVVTAEVPWPRCEVANASLTMRSSSSWCDPA